MRHGPLTAEVADGRVTKALAKPDILGIGTPAARIASRSPDHIGLAAAWPPLASATRRD